MVIIYINIYKYFFYVCKYFLYIFSGEVIFWLWLQNMHVNPLSDKDRAAGYWKSKKQIWNIWTLPSQKNPEGLSPESEENNEIKEFMKKEKTTKRCFIVDVHSVFGNLNTKMTIKVKMC